MLALAGACFVQCQNHQSAFMATDAQSHQVVLTCLQRWFFFVSSKKKDWPGLQRHETQFSFTVNSDQTPCASWWHSVRKVQLGHSAKNNTMASTMRTNGEGEEKVTSLHATHGSEEKKLRRKKVASTIRKKSFFFYFRNEWKTKSFFFTNKK